MEPNCLQGLPDEVLLRIFKHLDLNTLVKCSKVCDRWCEISKDFTSLSTVVLKTNTFNRHIELINWLIEQNTPVKEFEWHAGVEFEYEIIDVASQSLYSDAILCPCHYSRKRFLPFWKKMNIFFDHFYLELNSLKIHNIMCSKISDVYRQIGKCKQLRTLCLAEETRKSGPCVEPIPYEFLQLELLDTLVLDNVNIPYRNVMFILRKNKNLKHLSLNNYYPKPFRPLDFIMDTIVTSNLKMTALRLFNAGCLQSPGAGLLSELARNNLKKLSLDKTLIHSLEEQLLTENSSMCASTVQELQLNEVFKLDFFYFFRKIEFWNNVEHLSVVFAVPRFQQNPIAQKELNHLKTFCETAAQSFPKLKSITFYNIYLHKSDIDKFDRKLITFKSEDLLHRNVF